MLLFLRFRVVIKNPLSNIYYLQLWIVHLTNHPVNVKLQSNIFFPKDCITYWYYTMVLCLLLHLKSATRSEKKKRICDIICINAYPKSCFISLYIDYDGNIHFLWFLIIFSKKCFIEKKRVVFIILRNVIVTSESTSTSIYKFCHVTVIVFSNIWSI